MAADLSLSLLGSRVAVQGGDSDLLRSSRDLWSRCLDGAPSSPSDLAIATLPGETEAGLIARVVREACEASAGRLLTVWASAVAGGHGRVVALLSADVAARTEAVQALAGQGFGYVSGSVLAVDADGAVAPLPDPLHIAHATDDGGRVRLLRSPDALGLPPCPDRLQLARLVVLDRRTDEPGARLVREDLLQSLQVITPQITSAAANVLPLRRLCRAIEQAGGIYRLRYADVVEVGPALNDLLASSPLEEPATWGPLASPRDTLDSVGWRIRDGRVHRAPYRDAVWIGDEALVSIDAVPTRLGPLGLTVWELAADAPTLAELVDGVVDQHGAHPEAEALVTEAVTSMVDSGLLGYAQPRSIGAILPDGRPRSVRWRLRRPSP